jgi:phosphoglycolate phosphatase
LTTATRTWADSYRRALIHRLVLWNIDLTLVDVGRVWREACAHAFAQVTGRPLVALPQTAGRTDSEIFFEALAFNGAPGGAGPEATAPAAAMPAATAPAAAMPAATSPAGATGPDVTAGQQLLDAYTEALAAAFRARADLLASLGRALPGAQAAVAAVAGLPGVVQAVLTGSIKPNAICKLEAFGLARFLDLAVGGYGSDVYPKGALLLSARGRAGEKYGCAFGPDATVYVADAVRDVEAAATGGARCIAVASGRSSAAELRAAGADAVLDDLADTAAVVAAIDRLTTAVSAG